MMAAHLLDVLGRNEPPEAGLKSNARRVALARSLVTAALAEREQLTAHEQAASTGKGLPDAPFVQSIYELFGQWLKQAEQIAQRIEAMDAADAESAGLEELVDAMSCVRARLSLRPQQIESARRQVAEGQVITLGEHRDALRARIRG